MPSTSVMADDGVDIADADAPEIAEFLEPVETTESAEIETAEDDDYDAEPEGFVEDDASDDDDDSDDGDDNLLARLQAKAATLREEKADQAPASMDAPADAPEKAPIRAHVLRIKPGHTVEFEDDTTDDDVAEAEAKPKVEAIEVQLKDAGEELAEFEGDMSSSLSADDELDLQQELSELEDEYVAADPADIDVPEKPTDAVMAADEELAVLDDDLDEEDKSVAKIIAETNALIDDVEEAAAPKPQQALPVTTDATMSHLLKATDAQLNEPESSRRRNAIAQLKAAVAATEAARQLGDKATTSDEAESPFRGDLAQAKLIPSDNTGRPTRPGRPNQPKAPPLKLVASQRIDTDETSAQSDGPVRPRRVSTTASVAVNESDASNFAEFAAEMGATELPDLLEAAAAYTAFVEGNEDFSRPQIMSKVQLTTDAQISREDGLRHFGKLLREGRISKVRGGRFQISEDTRFNPDARSA